MKWLVIVFILTVVHYAQQQTGQQPDYIANAKECAKETSVDVSLIAKIYTNGEFPEDKNLKCFFLCLYVKVGEMTASGQIMPDVIKSHSAPTVTPAQTSQIVDACQNSTGADPCDIAYSLTKCTIGVALKILGKD